MKKEETTLPDFFSDTELINLATYFSDNYQKLSVGTYKSDNKKYQINYVENLQRSDTDTTPSLARIARSTHIIDLNKTMFSNKQFTSDYVFFIILWLQLVVRNKNKLLSDKLTTEYYLTTNRSTKNLLKAQVQSLSNEPSELNKERFEMITEMLDKTPTT